MANNLAAQTWIIDTAAATTIKAGRTFITGFLFRSYSTTGHKATVKDLVRNVVIFEAEGLATGEWIDTDWSNPQVVQNIAVTTLDSGVLEIRTL